MSRYLFAEVALAVLTMFELGYINTKLGVMEMRSM